MAKADDWDVKQQTKPRTPLFFSAVSLAKQKYMSIIFGLLNPIPLDDDSAAIRTFALNDTNRSRNGKSTVEA